MMLCNVVCFDMHLLIVFMLLGKLDKCWPIDKL
jgi:hypothetical protein